MISSWRTACCLLNYYTAFFSSSIRGGFELIEIARIRGLEIIRDDEWRDVKWMFSRGGLPIVAGSRSRWEIAPNYEERSVFARFARRHSWLPAWCCFAWKCSSSWQPVTRLASFPAYYRLSSLFYVIPRVSIALLDRFDPPCPSLLTSRSSIFRSSKNLLSAEKEIIILSNFCFFQQGINDSIQFFTLRWKIKVVNSFLSRFNDCI